MMTSASRCARLDYLNLQEPRDESQINTIDIVDRLLIEDDIETYQKINIGQTRAKLTSTLGSDIAQCLAKRAECRFPLKKAGIFDWADTPIVDDCRTSIVSMENTVDHANNQVKHVDSQRCGSYGSGTRAWPILERIDEDSGTNCLKKPEPFGGTDDLYQKYDIGPNTEMAAEVMEALFNASTVSYDIKENERPEDSVVINMTKGSKVDKTCAVHLPIQKRKVTCMRQRSGVGTEYKKIKVDDTVRENGESSVSYTTRPSTSKTRKYPKQMAGKAGRNVSSGIIQRDIDHEVSDIITRSGTDDSNIPLSLDTDALIHPKRRTYMFTAGSSKIEFIEAIKPTTLRAKTTEVKKLSTADTVSISDRDTASGMRMSQHSSFTDHEASAASSYFNPLAETFTVGLEKQSIPEKEGHDSSLMLSVPLRALNGAGPQARICTSKTLKRVLKSPGYRELASLFRNEVSPVLQSSRRRRRHMPTVRVLLSQSMDNETLNVQTKGRRVLITPNAKPSKELLKSLVAISHGRVLERNPMSKMKNRSLVGAFVISCERDYKICVPFIKNSFEVFESGLVLNGIVTQKLEFERYRVFQDKTV